MAEPQDPQLDDAAPDEQNEPTVHHESSRKKRSKESGSMQLNITSMIDVIFLLLIYFVITANFTFDEGVLTAKLPQGAGQPTETDLKPPDEPMNIILSSVDVSSVKITINQTQYAANFTELHRLLMSLQHDPTRGLNGPYAPDNPVIIKPDGQVRWQHVVNAFNAAVRARYANVAFSAGG